MNVRQLYTFHLQNGGFGMGGEPLKIRQMRKKWLTLLGGSLTTHDGGTIRLAWAPKSHISSIFCILKHSTLLWYWKEISLSFSLMYKYITLRWVKVLKITPCLRKDQLSYRNSALWLCYFFWITLKKSTF